jgi:bifunctional DNase/RNase
MNKVRLKVLGLSYSQTQVGSYILVLSEIDGDKKVPIIVKTHDAQYIALKVEGVKSPRPAIYDVVKSITSALGSDVMEVYIQDIVEGIFYAKLILSNGVEEFDIDCSIGDAISLSLIYECDLTASSHVMTMVGISIDDNGKVDDTNTPRKSVVGIDNLELMLQNAIDNEEYEIASQLRDRIKELGNE